MIGAGRTLQRRLSLSESYCAKSLQVRHQCNPFSPPRYNDFSVLENHHVSAAFHTMMHQNRYNDFSVLENHHVSAAFHTMMHQKVDPLSSLSETQYQQVRKMMITMILATDTANHFTELSLFKTKVATALGRSGEGGSSGGGGAMGGSSGGGSGGAGKSGINNPNNPGGGSGNRVGSDGRALLNFPQKDSPEDKQILMNILLHASDIGNACRPTATYLKWVSKIMEEFFRQGDLEREKNLPVSMFFDRNNTSIPKCQMGYIDVLVLPLYSVLGQLIPEVGSVCCEYLEVNRKYVSKQAKVTDEEPTDGLLANKKKEGADASGNGIAGAMKRGFGRLFGGGRKE